MFWRWDEEVCHPEGRAMPSPLTLRGGIAPSGGYVGLLERWPRPRGLLPPRTPALLLPRTLGRLG